MSDITSVAAGLAAIAGSVAVLSGVFAEINYQMDNAFGSESQGDLKSIGDVFKVLINIVGSFFRILNFGGRFFTVAFLNFFDTIRISTFIFV